MKYSNFISPLAKLLINSSDFMFSSK